MEPARPAPANRFFSTRFRWRLAAGATAAWSATARRKVKSARLSNLRRTTRRWSRRLGTRHRNCRCRPYFAAPATGGRWPQPRFRQRSADDHGEAVAGDRQRTWSKFMWPARRPRARQSTGTHRGHHLVDAFGGMPNLAAAGGGTVDGRQRQIPRPQSIERAARVEMARAEGRLPAPRLSACFNQACRRSWRRSRAGRAAFHHNAGREGRGRNCAMSTRR